MSFSLRNAAPQGIRWQNLLPGLLILAGLAAYLNTFTVPFLFDDYPALVDNPHLRRLWPLARALWAPAGSPLEGRPLASLSFALNYALSGLRVWSYHAVNVLLHLLAGLVAFGLVRRTLLCPRLAPRYADAASHLAFAVSLLWLVHPLLTESVTYILQRTEVLMGLCYLLTLYCTTRSATSLRQGRWQAAAVLACAAGMASKEVMVSCPVIVWLYDRIFLARSSRELWAKRGRLYLGLASTWLLLAGLVASVHRPEVGFRVGYLTAVGYLRLQTIALVRYLRLAVWPTGLLFDYQRWVEARLALWIPCGLLILLFLGAIGWAWRRRPALAFLGAWVFLILAPTSSILVLATEIAAERRMYLPLLAVVTLGALGLWTVLQRCLASHAHLRRGLFMTLTIGLSVLLGALTLHRNAAYASAETLWRDAVAKNPRSVRAHHNLGFALFEQWKMETAARQYEAALRLDPSYAKAHNGLGMIRVTQGHLDEATAQFLTALRLDPASAQAHLNLGNVLMQAGKPTEAMASFIGALQCDPDFAEAHTGLGVALAQHGNLDAAIDRFATALWLRPDLIWIRRNLDVALVDLAKQRAGSALTGSGATSHDAGPADAR